VRALAEGGFVASRDGTLDFYDENRLIVSREMRPTARSINAYGRNRGVRH
jgi:hypothetical protein